MTRRSITRQFVTLAVAASALGPLVTGCADGNSDESTEATSPTTSAATTPSASASQAATDPNVPCARPEDKVVATKAGQYPLYVHLVGSGPRGVVLLPQSDGDACRREPTARRLAAAGYHVATFTPWVLPYPSTAQAATAALTRAGAKKIVLAGASQGGGVALGAAAGLKPRPVAVISLSGVTDPGGGVDVKAGAAKYTGPVLIVGAEQDSSPTAAETRQISADRPGEEELLLVAGGAHGIGLLDDPSAAPTAAFDRFLAKALPR